MKKKNKADIAPSTIVYALLAIALLVFLLLLLSPVRDKMYSLWEGIVNVLRFGA